MRRRLAVGSILTAVLLLWPADAASAHPLGNFTVNRYSAIHVMPREIRVDYVVDMAEIPTFQVLSEIDLNADGAASNAELGAWASVTAPELAQGLTMTIDGETVALSVRGASARLLPGQGGLDTLRFEGDFTASAPPQGRLVFVDGNFQGQVGWKEITAAGRDGAALSGSTVPAESVSGALRSYPQDLLSSPPDVTSMSASFTPGASLPMTGGGGSTATGVGARPGTDGGPFAGLLASRGLPLVLLGIGIAVAFGAWHALLPGHGKTLMAAYMVGSHARVRHAVAVGSAVAVMHTASVLALGLAVLTLERTFRPETLYPWLGLLSGVVALGLGAYLLISRLSAWGLERRHQAAHLHGGDHDHTRALPEGAPLSPKGVLALALAGGILPAPSALLVMLSAINAHRAVYGIALVLAFSAGLAAALTVVGLGALTAREAMASRLSTTAGRLVPVLSAAAIVAVGVFLTVRGVGRV